MTMKRLRSHGITKNQLKNIRMQRKDPGTMNNKCLDYNYRMNDIQAALGRSQLKRLDKIVRKRNLNWNTTKQLTKGLEN